MLTGELKSQIDRVWDAFWSGGISNPLEVIEQITYLLFLRRLRAIVARRSRQAAQQNFSGPGLRELPMPLPPLELQRDFARHVTVMEKLKTAHRASLAEMDRLFASLQHRAFRGEL